jgi:hypothetical protein
MASALRAGAFLALSMWSFTQSAFRSRQAEFTKDALQVGKLRGSPRGRICRAPLTQPTRAQTSPARSFA